jgi:hypothetical protein
MTRWIAALTALVTVAELPVARAQDSSEGDRVPAVPESYFREPAPPAPGAAAREPTFRGIPPEGTYPEPDQAFRLHGWLKVNADRYAMMRTFVAIFGIVAGVLSLTVGALALSSDEKPIALGLGPAFAGGGGLELGMGIGSLQLTSPAEDRLERFRLLRRALNPRQLGAFEGEFQTEAAQAEYGRKVGGVVGFGMAGGGAITAALGFTVARDEDVRLLTATVGGVLLVTGLLVGVLVLAIKAPIEEEWEQYQRGLGSTEALEEMGNRPALRPAETW